MDDRRPELARLVRRRRVARGLTLEQAAELGQISKGAWRNVENARPASDLALAGVDRALGWADNSCEDFLAGAAGDVDASGERMEEVVDGEKRVTFPVPPGTSPLELRRLRAKARRMLRDLDAFTDGDANP